MFFARKNVRKKKQKLEQTELLFLFEDKKWMRKMLSTTKLLEIMKVVRFMYFTFNKATPTEEWIQPQENTFQSHRTTDLVALPDFFKTQNKETNFVEEALEDDPSLSINMVSDFPTARQYQDPQESQFFFLDTENEANAVRLI